MSEDRNHREAAGESGRSGPGGILRFGPCSPVTYGFAALDGPPGGRPADPVVVALEPPLRDALAQTYAACLEQNIRDPEMLANEPELADKDVVAADLRSDPGAMACLRGVEPTVTQRAVRIQIIKKYSGGTETEEVSSQLEDIPCKLSLHAQQSARAAYSAATTYAEPFVGLIVGVLAYGFVALTGFLAGYLVFAWL